MYELVALILVTHIDKGIAEPLLAWLGGIETPLTGVYLFATVLWCGDCSLFAHVLGRFLIWTL